MSEKRARLTRTMTEIDTMCSLDFPKNSTGVVTEEDGSFLFSPDNTHAEFGFYLATSDFEYIKEMK